MMWKELIAAYHDGELDAANRRVAERVLAERADARAYLADLRMLDGALGRAKNLAPSAKLRDEFWARLDAESIAARRAPLRAVRRPKHTSKRAGGFGIWFSSAAAVLLAIGAALWVIADAPVDPAPVGPNAGTQSPATIANTAANRTPANSQTPTTNQQQPAPGTPAPEPDVVGTPAPDADMLLAMDMLASDLDFDALASLTKEDVELLGDETVLNILENYDYR